MAKAKKLPSGQWRTLVYSHTDANGKRKYESFTADSKKESEYLAAEFALNKKRKKNPSNFTLGEAIDKYIADLEGKRSVTTISGYRKIRNYAFQSIMDVQLKNIDEDVLNDAITKEINRNVIIYGNGHKSKKKGKPLSAKTVKNEFGLVTATLNMNDVELNMKKIKLPEVAEKKKNLPLPHVIYEVVRGTDMELPVLLAMWLSFSESEICGLTRSKSLIADGEFIYISEVVVYANGEEHRKELAKKNTRKRVLQLPEYLKKLIDQLPPEQDRLVLMTGHDMYDRLRRLLKKNNLPHITFHELRHMNASVMATLNVPDIYAQSRGGWATDNVMKKIYTHEFTEERIAIDNKIDDYFNDMINDKCNTKYNTKK